MIPYFTEILGEELRACCVEGCGWKDKGRNYGTYLPDGKYYCTKHGDEVWEKLQHETVDNPLDFLDAEV